MYRTCHKIPVFVGAAAVIPLASTQRKLEALFGRKVDLVSKDGLKPGICLHILATAQVLYAA